MLPVSTKENEVASIYVVSRSGRQYHQQLVLIYSFILDLGYDGRSTESVANIERIAGRCDPVNFDESSKSQRDVGRITERLDSSV